MYSSRMTKKFNRIYKEASKPQNCLPIDFEKDRLVLFSDHHKGDGSAADDFKKNASLYDDALAFYKEKMFKLIVIGDNEELWENSYNQVVTQYRDVITEEIGMAPISPDQRKIRLFGNHDKEVSLRRFKRFLLNKKEKILEEVDNREGLCLGEDIFIIHGHQGRFFEDIAWRISRWAVQIIWKTIQKLLHIGIDGPAENFEIRDDLEVQYYKWAKAKKIMLICGHTHRALFSSLTHYDRLLIEIKRLRRLLAEASPDNRENLEKEIEEKRKEKEKILERRMGQVPKSFAAPSELPVPCYFNDGCCGYTNGITCIEIECRVIRLIKWQRNSGERHVLAENDIHLLLEYIKKGRPVDKTLEASLKD